MMQKRLWIAVLTMASLVTGCKKSDQAAPPPAAAPAPATAPAAAGAPATTAPEAAPEAAPPVAPANEGATAPAPASPAEGAPAAEPAAPAAPTSVTLPVNTRLNVRLSQTLNTKDVNDGQAFAGRLSTPVVVGGTTVFAAGTRVNGVVVDSKSPGKFKGEGVLTIRVVSVGNESVRTNVRSQVVKGKGKRTAGFIGGGAGLGAIIGGVAGGGKGAAIGALAGGGAGTAGGALTGNKEVEWPAETVLTFRLAAAKTVQM